MPVIDDFDRARPAAASYERALMVRRLTSSAERLDLPLSANG